MGTVQAQGSWREPPVLWAPEKAPGCKRWALRKQEVAEAMQQPELEMVGQEWGPCAAAGQMFVSS